MKKIGGDLSVEIWPLYGNFKEHKKHKGSLKKHEGCILLF